MATEIEAKVKAPSHDALRAKLQQAHATFKGKTEELNTFFDTPDKSLLSSDCGLRIRRNKRASGETLIVTYKGPKQQGPYKSREEIEVGVTDHDALVSMFSKLGYEITLSFEKRRETWELDGCTVELDELPQNINGGTFAEVEGPSEQAVRNVLEKLGLENEPMIKRGYSDMIANYLKEKGGDRIAKF